MVTTGLVNSTYSGYCDFVIPAAGTSRSSVNATFKKTLYNVSLSKKFGDSVMAYATVGSSYRMPSPRAEPGMPSSLLFPNPESATSYEVGVKTNLSRNLKFNVAAFQIEYQGQLTKFQGIKFYDITNPDKPGLTGVTSYFNTNARVRGIEAEISARPIDGLSIDANLSYAQIKSKGGLVPCNGSTALTFDHPINYCPAVAGQKVNPSPEFQATVSASYERPITSTLGGYIRTNVNFQGESQNYGISTVPTKSYAIVDLFAGLKGNDDSWEIGAYAKNLFNVKRVLASNPVNALYSFGAADLGYQQVSLNLPSEFGVMLRYRFGSR